MFTAKVDMRGMNAGIAGLIDRVGLNSAVVVAKEMGELIKTLVRISPPKDPKKTGESIRRNVIGKFEMAKHGGYRGFEETSGKVGASGIKWYSVDEKFLRGVKPESDRRDASADDLYRVYHRLTKKGRMIFPFRHPRRRQRVMISQKILTRDKTVDKVIVRVKGHRGRLKAGWLVSVLRGAIKITGANMPQKWVTKHLNSKTRGDFISGLNNKRFPSFTIMNRAKGISNAVATGFVNAAVKIRVKAMAANALLFMRGKKRLADYAR